MCIIKSSEWHQAIETNKRTPQIPVAVLSDGKLTFDSFHSFAVALAKSQDHQSYLRGFLRLATMQCGTSVVASRDTLLHERTKAGAVGEG